MDFLIERHRIFRHLAPGVVTAIRMGVRLSSAGFDWMSAGKEIVFEFLRKHIDNLNRTVMTKPNIIQSFV